MPRHGVFVWSFGPEDLADQYEVFGLVSGLAAERAAQNLTDDELANLRAVHAEMSVSRDGERLELLNERFHMIINRASGSRRLAWLVRFLSGSVPRGYAAGGWQIANRHHATIIERLGARDAEGAGRAMRDHIRQSGEHALGVLAESGIWKA